MKNNHIYKILKKYISTTTQDQKDISLRIKKKNKKINALICEYFKDNSNEAQKWILEDIFPSDLINKIKKIINYRNNSKVYFDLTDDEFLQLYQCNLPTFITESVSFMKRLQDINNKKDNLSPSTC